MSELKKVLYIEDEPDIRAVAEIALQQIGGLVLKCCASGPEGLESISDFDPQLILLDVMMPGMDGPTVLAHIRENTDYQHIPVVFITAKVQAAEVEDLMELGAFAAISKPFSPMEIAGQLRDIDRIATNALRTASRRKLKAVDRELLQDIIDADTLLD